MKPATVVALCVLAAGCADRTRVVLDKPGASAEERQRDEAYCAGLAAADEERARVMAATAPERTAFEACMEARGYPVVERSGVRR